MRQVMNWLLAPIAAVALGCGGSTPPPAAIQNGSAEDNASGVVIAPISGGSAESGAASPAPTSATNTPEAVVASFLASLRSGDEATAANLLTPKARTETAKNDLTVQPPGTPEATYEVAAAEYVTDRKVGAHVRSLWSEPVGDGQTESYEITWVLRKESIGWRIVGMATEILPGESPIFLNFENPADMMRVWEEADAALAAAEQAATTGQSPNQPEVRQATAPTDPGLQKR